MATKAGSASVNALGGAARNFSVTEVNDLDYSIDTDSLTTKVYHGVSIVASPFGGGQEHIVGRIQSWQPDAYTREGVHLYELSGVAWGRPVEYVPGRATGYTITCTRAEVWDSEMEIAFGASKKATLFLDLVDQTRPFTVKEFWLRGSENKQTWEYRGCWFQGKNYDAITSDGDGVTRISGTIAYTSRNLAV